MLWSLHYCDCPWSGCFRTCANLLARTYSRPLLGVIIALNLVLWVMKKYFHYNWLKTTSAWRVQANKMHFFQKYALKKCTHFLSWMSKSYFDARNFRDKKVLQFSSHSNWTATGNFLSAIWVPHSHLWAIIVGTASLNQS